MFNGYNETPLISYEFSQERANKKQENVPKWSYEHEPGGQQTQSHLNSRQPEFWSGKAGYVGLPNVVKCSCAGCYPSSESQSYQGDSTRHRPWLPRTFPVPLNGSNEQCKLPACQWDSTTLNQNSCYPENNAQFVQENGGKHTFYRHYQESRLPEPNQPGVITSLNNADFGKKQKEEISLQNVMRQPVFCNPIYNLTKRPESRNYCDSNEKYSNAASFSVDQHIPRLPVVESYIKSVPSNLSQNRVPSTGYRSVKENVSQPYLNPGYGDSRKMYTEANLENEKINESFLAGTLSTNTHTDYSHFGREISEGEPQKFLDNVRHSDYYFRKNFQDVINRNNQILENRKDCVITQINQMNLSEQYKMARSKYQEAVKPSCETYYPKDFDKTRTENHFPENSACFQRNEDKNENKNVHARLTRPALIFNNPRFVDGMQNAFPYQNNPGYRNHARPEYSYQGYNAQHRLEYPASIPRNDFGQCRSVPQQMQPYEQFIPPNSNNGFIYNSPCQQNADKTTQIHGEKASHSFALDSVPNALEKQNASEGLNKNGTSKISPLRLLRKKKFINVPHEPSPSVSTNDTPPGLDVRKFWSTWAEEEEENVPSTQIMVLDCQNIDPEQAKLLNLYDLNPVRTVQLESGSVVIKEAKEPEILPLGEISASEKSMAVELKNDMIANNEPFKNQEESSANAERNIPTPPAAVNSKPTAIESVVQVLSPSMPKIVKMGSENQVENCEVLDKWTEKKFDFLKRAEESKAAEILRHEEEKKKILETRLSLQESLKKIEKPLEKVTNEKKPESRLLVDENSQSNSPFNGNEISKLPTCEYRRNKFLDYSDRKVIVSAEEREKNEKKLTEDSHISNTKPIPLNEKEKGDIKPEEKNSVDQLLSVNSRLKDEPGFEMNDILQKMSEIHFQNKDMKLENGTRDLITKKSRNLTKKLKRKKSDHQTEDQRTDKLTLETVKFSIQKSHDLKISFKVLNNSKKCSDEELENKDMETEENPVEDSKNSTELITLKYKSIQRDGDRMSEAKKSKKRFKWKKNVPDERTPVLKIKKSRYMPQPTERDPLGTYEDEENDCDDASQKPYFDEYSASDDFHVHETVDSAKIKLTFKRHKTNFETQYKVNNSMEDLSEVVPIRDEQEEAVMKSNYKKSRKNKLDQIFAEAGVESFEENPDHNIGSDVDSILKENALALGVEEVAKSPIASHDSSSEEEEEENYVLGSTTEITSTLDNGFFNNEKVALESDNENSMRFEESIKNTFKRNQKEVELIENGENSHDEISLPRYSDENSKEFICNKAEDKIKEEEKVFESEEIQEISLDFIRTESSPEIETDDKSGKTGKSDGRREKNRVEISEENTELESFRNFEISHSEIQESSYEFDNEKPQIKTSVEVNTFLNEIEPPEDIQTMLPPLFSGDHSTTNSTNLEPIDENSPKKTEENENASRTELAITKDFDLTPMSCDAVETPMENDFKPEDIEFPSALVESPVVTPEEPKEYEKESNQQQTEITDDSQLSLNEDKFECDNVSDLQMSSEKINCENQTCSEKTNLEEIQISLEETNCEGVLLKSEETDAEEYKMSIENPDCEEVEKQPEKTSPAVFQMSPEIINTEEDGESSADVIQSVSETKLDEVEINSERTDSETNKPKNLCHFENNDPEKETSEVVCVNNLSEKKENDCQIPEITFTDISSENGVSNDNDYNVLLEDNATGTEVTENLSINLKNTEKNSELDQETNVRDDSAEESSIETYRNELEISVETSSAERHDRENRQENTQNDLPSVELEEGEIIDSSDEEKSSEKEKNSINSPVHDKNNKIKKFFDFVQRKVKRRNSTEPKISGSEEGSHFITWSKKKFSRLKSCPPEIKFILKESCIPETKESELEAALDFKVTEIPLPIGPWPHYSCFDLKKSNGLIRVRSNHTEAKEKPKELISLKPLQVPLEEFQSDSPLVKNDVKNEQNVVPEAEISPQGLFQRGTKIKFSISKRSKFSKINLKNADFSLDVFSKSNVKGKSEKNRSDVKINEKVKTNSEEDLTPVECQSEQVPNANIAKNLEEAKNDKELKEQEKEFQPHVELLGEDFEENIEVNAMNDYLRDEFYECEDIPTSEDLTNGDDLEMENVNDDKFRNIMQNCLENAKKFLNVGNLKLFSCSVDDLLELDCQTMEEQEPHPNHISRDVLLTSCEDTNDDLGLSENTQPPELSMDFVPSFCSDVCPEILPVDNWPYLEEEVPSSPTKTKQEETDLIPPLETMSSHNSLNSSDSHHQFPAKNGENYFKRFRRRSLMSDGEAVRMCSKIGAQRRNTVTGFTRMPSMKEVRDIKTELMKWTRGKDDSEKQSLKCRLSLEKLKSKQGIDFELKNERIRRMSEGTLQDENGIKGKNGKILDFKSPTWQPKVMLLRISKSELKKMQRDSEHQNRLESKTVKVYGKREFSNEAENQDVPAVKKPRQKSNMEKVHVKLEQEGIEIDSGSEKEDRFERLTGLESIKGSLNVSSDERRRKKLRFRNLHTKRKSDTKYEDISAQKFFPDHSTVVENALKEMFKDSDRVSDSFTKSTKETSKIVEKINNSTETLILGNKSEGKHEKFSNEHREEHKNREKKKEGSHKERRREKGEQHRHRDRHKDSEKGHSRREYNHREWSQYSRRSSEHSDESKGRSRDRSRSNSGGDTSKDQKENISEETWFCEVCGFNDVEERVTHIKNHPFHCQSCHLAFKTEAYFVNHLTKKHKNIRNQHHCLLCELSFDTENQYHKHLETREHRHLESVEKNTINTLFTLLTGSPCPVLGLVEMKPEWLPNQAGTVHFYHQATPLSLALQYLKLHHDLTSISTVSSTQSN